MLNIFIGFEQSNKYVISVWNLWGYFTAVMMHSFTFIANELGETLGFIAEEPRGFFSTFGRQIFRTHRPFRALVMDSVGTPVLWVCIQLHAFSKNGL